MNIFSGLKDILGQINKIDGSIYLHGKDFADVYAKNIALEEEIAQRTKELEQANQTILTLNSVWNMMNSSQPLENMLDNIVKILHEDMGYNFVTILKLENEKNDEPYLSIKSISEDRYFNEALDYIKTNISEYKIPYIEDSFIGKALKEQIIYSTTDIKSTIKLLFPQLIEEQIEKMMKEITSQSCAIVPLKNNNNNFGCVIIASNRAEITDTENNFLTLFANQIELAVTVADLFEEVKKQAITDPLTGLFNRRYFEENIIKEAERSLRLNQPFSLISMDLDYLKRINDTYGHQFGDIAIKTIANVLKKEARSIDIPARIGGEEFNLLLPGVDTNGALIAAERIRKSIENQVIDTIGGITASIGVATFLKHSDRIDELTELADQAMYKAKLNGRNQVQIASSKSQYDWQQTAIDTFFDILSKKLIPVSDEVSKTIFQKLNKVKIDNKNSEETLFSITDIISQIYNRKYKEGTTKSKLALAEMLARKLELPEIEIDKLRLAILLYDIGNTMIPDEIFNKKEPLTQEEKEIIKTHPVIAAREILKPISKIQDIIPIIESHHENWDGNGYPNQKTGADIPITSQIVLLVDSFFAMSQDRPYRNAYNTDEIIDIIKSESGTRWNSKLVDDFVYVLKNERDINLR